MTAINQLSTLINAKREQSDISVTDLAESSGVARAALYRFMKGGDIRMSTFIALADTLDLDIVLAPKAVSASLQSGAVSSSTALASLDQAQSGPRSAVESRAERILARLRGGSS